MATVKARNEIATLRAIGAYCDLEANNGRCAVLVCGELTKDLPKKYGVGPDRLRQLAYKGWRLCNPLHHWTYGILLDEELQDLAPLQDWLEVLSKEPNDSEDSSMELQ